MRCVLKQQSTLIAFMDSSGQENWADKYSHFYLATTKKSEMTPLERRKPQSDDEKLRTEKPPSTNLNSIENLTERIKRGPEARASFSSSHVDKGIAYQIRALRDRQELSQEDLAAKVGMNQNAISRLESPERGRPTITTLKRLAEAFDVALVVRFVPFSKLVKWVSGTSFVEDGLSTESLAVPNFEDELKSGTFEWQKVPVLKVSQAPIVPLLKLAEYPKIKDEWADLIFGAKANTVTSKTDPYAIWIKAAPKETRTHA